MNIVTRPKGRVELVESQNLIHLPLIEIIQLGHRPFQDQLKRRLIFFLSSPAAWPIVEDWASDHFSEGGQSKIFCLSKGASRSVEKMGYRVDWQSRLPSIEGVMQSLPLEFNNLLSEPLKNYLVLHPCSLGTQVKQSVFKMKTGLEIRNLPVYQSVLPKQAESSFHALDFSAHLNWFFYSGSAVTNFLKLLEKSEALIGDSELHKWTFNCIGQTSTKTFQMSQFFQSKKLSITELTYQEADELLKDVS